MSGQGFKPAQDFRLSRAALGAQLQGLAGQQQGLLGSALAKLRQNSDTIMGCGTVWNPASGRWEQHGSIVSDYNGTVLVP
ncbi:MAG: hypothetical protein JNJ71_18880 [Rubrivivax sp.]|nr:hypothetical protein [Rubrivivax sp.]